MKTIVFNSQKGGSGKTSLCAHVAVEAEHSGDGPVYLIDADPQVTLSTWHEMREAQKPHRIETALADLFKPNRSETPKEREGRIDRIRTELAGAIHTLDQTHHAAYCLIDTPPTREDEITELFRVADLVLVPVRPSPSDLWAVAATVGLLKQTATPFLFVLNQATLNANITAQAVASLSHYGPVAQNIIGIRVPYAAAMTELANRGPAASEIAGLWMNIKSCLHAGMQTKVRAHA
jgi:chromosome partitioning protein